MAKQQEQKLIVILELFAFDIKHFKVDLLDIVENYQIK